MIGSGKGRIGGFYHDIMETDTEYSHRRCRIPSGYIGTDKEGGYDFVWIRVKPRMLVTWGLLGIPSTDYRNRSNPEKTE
jgi:hypothetical protein